MGCDNKRIALFRKVTPCSENCTDIGPVIAAPIIEDVDIKFL
jgi:hypothetical protein